VKLDERVLRLIAVGASVTANCQPCLETNIAQALKNGADEDEIAEAISVGNMVRKGAASRLDQFISNLGQADPLTPDSSNHGCGCSS
jgi:AhpD family alkylhydroperoxidase